MDTFTRRESRKLRLWILILGLITTLLLAASYTHAAAGNGDDEDDDDNGIGDMGEEGGMGDVDPAKLQEMMQAYYQEQYGAGGAGVGGEDGLGAGMDFGADGGDHDMPPPPPPPSEEDPNKDVLLVVSPQDKIQYEPPAKPASCVFLETFQSDSFEKTWTYSQKDQYQGRFGIGGGKNPAIPGDKGAILTEKARHYGATSKVNLDLSKSKDNVFVAQYELRIDNELTCSGAYLKFPKKPFTNPKQFDNDVPYSVMFGPDKCGDTSKVHVIIQSENPKTKALQEHHLVDPPRPFTLSGETHLYTLIIDLNTNTYQVKLDGKISKQGLLAEDFNPPFQPPEKIDDPEDTKPEDWIDNENMPDPAATKPDDWDEDAPRMIPDPEAIKPSDWLDKEPAEIPDPEVTKPDGWDDDEDGEWEAPTIPNPKCKEIGCGEWKATTIPNPEYKGKWSPPMVPNPKYIGPWAPRKIDNPEYYKVDKIALLPIDAVGIEIWAMDFGLVFDNIYVGTDSVEAEAFASATFGIKRDAEMKKVEEKRGKDKSSSGSPTQTKVKNAVLDVVEKIANTMDKVLAPLDAKLRKAGYGDHVDKLMGFLVDNPIIISTAIPAVLIVFFLILTGIQKSRKAAQRAAVPSRATGAKAKKTDAAQPDDIDASVSSVAAAVQSIENSKETEAADVGAVTGAAGAAGAAPTVRRRRHADY